MQANGVRPFKGKSTPFRYSLSKGLLRGIQLLSLHLGGGGSVKMRIYVNRRGGGLRQCERLRINFLKLVPSP